MERSLCLLQGTEVAREASPVSFAFYIDKQFLIEEYIVDRNMNPKPYVLKARGEKILRKIESERSAFETRQEERK